MYVYYLWGVDFGRCLATSGGMYQAKSVKSHSIVRLNYLWTLVRSDFGRLRCPGFFANCNFCIWCVCVPAVTRETSFVHRTPPGKLAFRICCRTVTLWIIVLAKPRNMYPILIHDMHNIPSGRNEQMSRKHNFWHWGYVILLKHSFVLITFYPIVLVLSFKHTNIRFRTVHLRPIMKKMHFSPILWMAMKFVRHVNVNWYRTAQSWKSFFFIKFAFSGILHMHLQHWNFW